MSGTRIRPRHRASALERVIADGLVESVFQPIVDLEQGAVAGFEVLTRPGVGSGFDGPIPLFDAAAERQMLWPLEIVTRRKALEAASRWPASVDLFMNCSPQVFADDRFPEEVAGAVMRTPGLRPSRVVLEITERSEPTRSEALTRQVERLKRLGFQIAIDDVGAGTSGLSRMMRLRPHWLKLDRELVRSIDRDRVRQNLIRFLVHFARLSGVRIIAEGVETEEELSTLIDLGILHAQGYHLGRPGPREQSLDAGAQEWLRERCAAARARRLCEPLGNRVVRLARDAVVAPAEMTVSQAAEELRRWPEAPGLAVVDRNVYVGWCDRERVLGAPDGTARVCGLVTPAPVWVSPDAAISDALDMAAVREAASFHEPLVVFESGRVHGIVMLKDLMAAGAEACRTPTIRSSALTGLPGRVRADEHVARLIDLARRDGDDARRTGAAVVDIRGFSGFNGAYGYDLGDQLLRDFANLLQLTLAREDDRVFLAHLWDDRFLVSAPGPVLEERVRALARRFARVAGAYCQTCLLGPERLEGRPAPTIGLRVVLVPDAFTRVSEPRDLVRLSETLRNEGGIPERLEPGCDLIRAPQSPQFRLSA